MCLPPGSFPLPDFGLWQLPGEAGGRFSSAVAPQGLPQPHGEFICPGEPQETWCRCPLRVSRLGLLPPALTPGSEGEEEGDSCQPLPVTWEGWDHWGWLPPGVDPVLLGPGWARVSGDSSHTGGAHWKLPTFCLCSLPGEKKSSPPPAATAKTQFSLRRRQVLRGKSSPVLKKTPSKGLMQVTRHRLCCLPPGRAHLPTKEGMTRRWGSGKLAQPCL